MLGLVVLGGAIGVLVRAALLLPVTDPAIVPWVTLGINAVGSFLLGVVVGWLDDRHPRARVFAGTGVLGGFTTYSAFALQSVLIGCERVLDRGGARRRLSHGRADRSDPRPVRRASYRRCAW